MGKVCKTCGLEKDEERFTKDPRNTDGLGAKCKDCFNARQRQLYPNRPIKRPKGSKDYEYHKKYNHGWIRTFPGWLQLIWTACRSRKKEVSIVKQDIADLWEKQKGICALTGQPMDYTAGKWAHNRPSLDRIDNTKGYHIDNVRLVWFAANAAKNVFTDEQLIQFCEYVVENHRRNKS